MTGGLLPSKNLHRSGSICWYHPGPDRSANMLPCQSRASHLCTGAAHLLGYATKAPDARAELGNLVRPTARVGLPPLPLHDVDKALFDVRPKQRTQLCRVLVDVEEKLFESLQPMVG